MNGSRMLSAASKEKPAPRTGFDGEFGSRIREERSELGINQRELAMMSGISAERLSRWENGWHYPHASPALRNLARRLDVRLSWLKRGEEPKHYGAAGGSYDPRG
jgi:transcriptional regulator with XRE-family HTH domain